MTAAFATMLRSLEPEILDDPAMDDEELDRYHRSLIRIHLALGHVRLVLSALHRHPYPVRRVIDLGCGRGGILRIIQKRLQVDVLGVDLRPPPRPCPSVPIVRADAVRAPLPPCDVALAVCLVHHLSEAELIELIRNVGRSARRLLVLDLVRHPLPLILFRVFVAPFLDRANAADGMQSIRRAFTAPELRSIVGRAVRGTGAEVRHRVAPGYLNQIVDITW